MIKGTQLTKKVMSKYRQWTSLWKSKSNNKSKRKYPPAYKQHRRIVQRRPFGQAWERPAMQATFNHAAKPTNTRHNHAVQHALLNLAMYFLL